MFFDFMSEKAQFFHTAQSVLLFIKIEQHGAIKVIEYEELTALPTNQ